MAFRTNKVPAIEERTVSGSSVSFNSAFALPLKACKVSFSATQAGSGTPSPDNVRTINGYSAINIGVVGKNWLNNPDQTTTGGSYIINNVNVPMVAGYYVLSFEFSGTHNSSSLRIDDENGTAIFTTSKTIVNGHNEFLLNLPSNCSFVKLYSNAVGTYSNFQIELGNQFTTYEPYIGNTYTTIQIGSTVYGGEYDARTGVLTVTHKGVLWSDLTIQQYNGHIYQANVSDILRPTSGTERQQGIMSSNIKVCSTVAINETMEDLSMLKLTDSVYTMISSASTATEARAILGSGQLVYELSTPTTIQLPPCPIDTLEGENNIWADIGYIDLTYKDLDIAKRGSFREVFKLPS